MSLILISFFIILPIMGISMVSWFKFWVVMELMTVSFSLMLLKSTFKEKVLKFFLIQAIASIMIMISFLNQNEMYKELMFLGLIFIIGSLLKLGMVPFHFWMPEISKNMVWILLFFLLTWMKLMPIFIMSLTTMKVMIFFILISLVFASMIQITMNSSKEILVFSSIVQMSWVIMLVFMNKKMSMIYYFIYMFILMMIFLSFNKLNYLYINNVIQKKAKMEVILSMLNISGIPPMLGFFPKWLALYCMILLKSVFSIMVFLIMSVLNVFIYLRFCYYFFLSNIQVKKMKKGGFYNLFMIIFSMMSILYFFMMI